MCNTKSDKSSSTKPKKMAGILTSKVLPYRHCMHCKQGRICKWPFPGVKPSHVLLVCSIARMHPLAALRLPLQMQEFQHPLTEQSPSGFVGCLSLLILGLTLYRNLLKLKLFSHKANWRVQPMSLEAQQRYFSYRAILVAIVSQKVFVLVFVGGIAQ